MGPWSQALAHHGYALLFGAVFLEAIGLPVPAALALLIAGAAAANGTLGAAVALGGSVGAMLVGDTLMYLLGRYTGLEVTAYCFPFPMDVRQLGAKDR